MPDNNEELNTYGVQAADFAKAIHVGRLTKDRRMFAEAPQDVTSEAIGAVGQFVEKHYGGGVVFEFPNGYKIDIQVTRTGNTAQGRGGARSDEN